MKKNKIKSIVLLSLTFLMVGACTQDFEEINKNSNSPEVVPASLLLPTVIKNPVNEVACLAWGYGNVVMQYSAKIQFTNEDRYNWGPRTNPYRNFYNALRDLNNIISIAEDNEQNNYKDLRIEKNQEY